MDRIFISTLIVTVALSLSSALGLVARHVMDQSETTAVQPTH